MELFLKNTRLHLCLQVHKPVQELLHRKKCLLADDPELAAAPADGNDGDGDGDDDDDHDDDADGNGVRTEYLRNEYL